jgi:hypothetical protein
LINKSLSPGGIYNLQCTIKGLTPCPSPKERGEEFIIYNLQCTMEDFTPEMVVNV